MQPGYCPIKFPFQQSGLESGCYDWLLGTSWTWKSMLRVTAPCAKCTNAYLKTSRVGLGWGCPGSRVKGLEGNLSAQISDASESASVFPFRAWASRRFSPNTMHIIPFQLSLGATVFLPVCYHHHKASFVPPNAFPGGNEIQMKVTVIVISGPIKLCFPVFCDEEEIGSYQ